MGVIKLINARTWAWQLTGFPSAVGQNCVGGRYICQLQRLTLRFCKIREDSRGLRQFIERDLLDFARFNRGTVVYLHPVRKQNPFLVGEYLNGRMCSLSVSNCSREEILRSLEYMRQRSGQPIVRFLQNTATAKPSVQGHWNPFTNISQEMNSLQYPCESIGQADESEISATEHLMRLSCEKWPDNVKIAAVE